MLSAAAVLALTQGETERGTGAGAIGALLRLTQSLAHGHAVLLRVEVVAVAGAASIDEAHALPLVHIKVPARHGGPAGARLRLQGTHS